MSSMDGEPMDGKIAPKNERPKSESPMIAIPRFVEWGEKLYGKPTTWSAFDIVDRALASMEFYREKFDEDLEGHEERFYALLAMRELRASMLKSMESEAKGERGEIRWPVEVRAKEPDLEGTVLSTLIIPRLDRGKIMAMERLKTDPVPVHVLGTVCGTTIPGTMVGEGGKLRIRVKPQNCNDAARTMMNIRLTFHENHMSGGDVHIILVAVAERTAADYE